MGKTTRQPKEAKTLLDHLRELRTRLLFSTLALTAASIVIYCFYNPILNILSAPLDAPLYYNSPAGGFAFVMKICFTGSLIITIPVLVYNLIMFIKPALGSDVAVKRVAFTSAMSMVMAILGAIFAYTCILPGTLHFFKGFEVDGLSAMISADSYLRFVTNIIITFVIMFQMPLLIMFIDNIKPLPPKKLLGYEKWVIIGSLVIALLVPFTYDLITSLLIALPIILLYNFSVIIIVLQHKYKAYKQRTMVHAVIARPSLNTSTDFNLLIEKFNDEFQEQPVKPKTAQMNSRQPIKQPTKVMPPTWVIERNMKRAALNKQVRVISDFKAQPVRSNRVLVS